MIPFTDMITEIFTNVYYNKNQFYRLVDDSVDILLKSTQLAEKYLQLAVRSLKIFFSSLHGF